MLGIYQRFHLALCQVELRATRVDESGCVLEYGVQFRRDGADLLNRAAGSATPPTIVPSQARRRLASFHASTASGLVGQRVAGGNTGKCAACFGTSQIPLRTQRTVSIYFKVQVVLNGQRDGILDREVQLSSAEQIF